MVSPLRPFLALIVLVMASVINGECNVYSTAIWCEEFLVDGPPDDSVWSYDVGGGGWGNNEVQTYTTENAVVENGVLKIKVIRTEKTRGKRVTYSYTSARIKTQDRVMFQYGTLVARVKIPDLTGGLWPAVWFLGANFPTIGWPGCGEIDLAEWGSAQAISDNKLNKRVGSAAHWGDENGGHVYEWDVLDSATPLTDGFHEYKMDWTPNYIRTFLDGNQIFEKDISNCQSCDPDFKAAHFIIINMAVGGFFTGVTSPSSPGGTMEVDYVRLYNNGHTILTVNPDPPGPGACSNCADLSGNYDACFACSSNCDWFANGAECRDKESCCSDCSCSDRPTCTSCDSCNWSGKQKTCTS